MIGDKVYWVSLGKLREGTVVKESKFRKKVWIKDNLNGYVFAVPVWEFKHHFSTNKKEVIEESIKFLESEIQSSRKQLKEMLDALSYWKNQLEEIDNE